MPCVSGPYVREWVVDHGLARKTKEKEAIVSRPELHRTCAGQRATAAGYRAENTDLVKSAEIMREREEVCSVRRACYAKSGTE
eukprot:3816079-Rhodomonas_salina.1